LFAAVHDPVADAPEFSGVGQRTGFPQDRGDELKSLAVTGNRESPDRFYHLDPARSQGMAEVAARFADLFDASGGQHRFVPHVEQLVFDGRAAGVEYQNFHGLFLGNYSTKTKKPTETFQQTVKP
jgi:hypothetical protein